MMIWGYEYYDDDAHDDDDDDDGDANEGVRQMWSEPESDLSDCDHICPSTKVPSPW